MLRLESVSVSYGGVPALDSIDLTVADHEIVSVLGPSGSGKSTLLRAIAGLAPDARGSIAWDGTDLTGTPTHRRDFGLMFQDHALFPHRDVVGNVAFGLRMRGLGRADIDQRTRATLDLVGLSGFERRKVSELSGGEQQRVALARALAPEPRLLMLDEPLGALDRALRDRLVGELRALFTHLGISVVFVTHDHDEAFALADRVVVMHAGRIAQDGTPADVWQHPADAFVARFLGWNVTSAFGAREVAVAPTALTLAPRGEGRAGTVVARTFRRDHFVLEVRLARAENLRVAVSLDADAPEIGDDVSVALRRDASVIPLDGQDPSRR